MINMINVSFPGREKSAFSFSNFSHSIFFPSRKIGKIGNQLEASFLLLTG
jgi:hypothetical protein